VAKEIKESTKKICRLFKENPDLASDREKIKNEMVELIERFEKLIGNLQQNNYDEFQ